MDRKTAKSAKTEGGASDTALRGRCLVRFDPARAELGGIAASLLDDISRRPGEYVVDFLLTENRQRVTYGKSEGTTLTVVYSRGESMVIWDDATRSVATISADGIPGSRIMPAKSIETSSQEKGEETVFVVMADDPSLGRVRHELTVSRRKEWARFGPSLMRVLHCGPACHSQSGLPWEQIAQAGLITHEMTVAQDGKELISELSFEGLELVEVSDRDFAPPKGYRPLEELLKEGGGKPPDPPPPGDGPTPTEIQVGVIKQALGEGSGGTRKAKKINELLTPDCLGSTRFGSVTASLHQDFLTIAQNTINIVAPLLGPTTITGGAWRVPWLGNLAALTAATPTAPGTGLFCFLRQARVPTSPPGPVGGGTGLLDLLAFQTLYERDAAGLVRTQREFTAGTLPSTLASWGVGAPTDANLIAASGDLTMVSLFDQRVIVEGYETAELGVFTVTGLIGTTPTFNFGSMSFAGTTTAPLFTVGLTGIAGTVNFASLGGGPLVTAATVGNTGNFVLGLSLPTTTLTAVVTRALTGFGWFVLIVGTVVFCLALPWLCPLAVTLATLAAFVLNNITTVTATATGVTWTLDVTFDFDPATERVEPFVTLLARTGTVTVATIPNTPNLIANMVDALIAAFGNLLDAWGGLLAGEATKAIEKALREQGLQLPVAGRQNGLRAIDGSAQSSTGGVLMLSADVRPIDEVASQPFTTQVVRRNAMEDQLLVAHLNMRRDLNPVPTTPPPGPGPALTVGTFAGLGLSQNALNYYVFQQWIQHRFEVTITDPAIINKVYGMAPNLFVRIPSRIHVWPATAPRIELAPHEIALGTRPLVVFFDDVRACFEISAAQGSDGPASVGVWELSCNFKTSATIELAWPWVFSLRVDPFISQGGFTEPRTWEFVDPNVPAIMGTLQPQDLAKIVDLIAQLIIAPISTVGVSAPTAPIGTWARPLPAMQQLVFPALQPPPPLRAQQVYLEMLGRRKALYVLPAIDTALFELVDGSGAPTFNIVLGFAGAPGPLPTTPRTMRCAQGTALRNFLLPMIGLPAGP